MDVAAHIRPATESSECCLLYFHAYVELASVLVADLFMPRSRNDSPFRDVLAVGSDARECIE